MPADIFTGTKFTLHKLKDIHVRDCPVYVLDTTLQQGSKLPKWHPRSRHRVFVKSSPNHSSNIPLVLNLATGYIPPQFHVIFDDSLRKFLSLSPEEESLSFWN